MGRGVGFRKVKYERLEQPEEVFSALALKDVNKLKEVWKLLYRIVYESSYREKEWLSLSKEIEAENDKEALEKAHQFIEQENNKKINSIERFGLIGLLRIDQPEKVTKIKIY